MRVLVIGAGIAGCTVACRLADHGIDVVLVEKKTDIGGYARSYGCKAVEKCQNCGVCLTGGLWGKVLGHKSILLFTESFIRELTGVPGEFSAVIATVIAGTGEQQQVEEERLDSIDFVVVCTGFDSQIRGISSHLHLEGTAGTFSENPGIMTGTQLEELMQTRTSTGLFKKTPDNIAFVQCLGSRDQHEAGLYCSRVCCSYSTRAAKVIRSYYPNCEITFFYMELQCVESGDYFKSLHELGIEFIKCRPLKVTGGIPVSVEYDDPGAGIKNREFDLVVLSGGIYAGNDNAFLAEVCRLGQDSDGFLKTVAEGCGIYVAGCARAPMKIDEAYADSLSVAGTILASFETGKQD